MTRVNDNAASCTMKAAARSRAKANEKGNKIVMRTIDVKETSLENAAIHVKA